MKHDVKLTNFVVNPGSETVEVGFEWNGVPYGITFPTVAQLLAENADIIQSPQEAARLLLSNLLVLGDTPDTLPARVGQTLTLEIAPAVQQVLSLR